MDSFDQDLSCLIGKRIIGVRGLHLGSECITFICDSGAEFTLCHKASKEGCDPIVTIYHIGGHAGAIVCGKPILEAEQFVQDLPGHEASKLKLDDGRVEVTWPHTRLVTSAGYLALRWLARTKKMFCDSHVKAEQVREAVAAKDLIPPSPKTGYL